MNLRKKREKEFNIDISSLVDVLFTLLIFFSLTSTFVKESGLKVELPEASSGSPLVSPEKYEITISSSGEIGLNSVPVQTVDEIGRASCRERV